MPAEFTPAEREAGARLLADLTAPDRIATALADLDRVPIVYGPRAHDDDCWQIHAQCLAARIRRTLTGEGHTDA